MVEQLRKNPKPVALLLLLAVTAAWGGTFVLVKGAVAHTAVLSFLAWRFIVAGGLLAVVRPSALVRLGRQGWARGVALGALLFGGYVLQTFGLRYTSAAVSGFLTGLQVVLTPLLGWLLLRDRPGARIWTATALAATGLAVVSLRGFSLGPGELLTLGSAALFATQIVGVGRWASSGQAYGLATVQLLTVAACSCLASLPGGPRPPQTSSAWAVVLVTAVAATAVAFVVQSWAQSHMSTGRTAIVLSMEPVFAAVAAAVVGEHLGWPVLAGGALVLVGMLTVELPLGVAQDDLAELSARGQALEGSRVVV